MSVGVVEVLMGRSEDSLAGVAVEFVATDCDLAESTRGGGARDSPPPRCPDIFYSI